MDSAKSNGRCEVENSQPTLVEGLDAELLDISRGWQDDLRTPPSSPRESTMPLSPFASSPRAMTPTFLIHPAQCPRTPPQTRQPHDMLSKNGLRPLSPLNGCSSRRFSHIKLAATPGTPRTLVQRGRPAFARHDSVVDIHRGSMATGLEPPSSPMRCAPSSPMRRKTPRSRLGLDASSTTSSHVHGLPETRPQSRYASEFHELKKLGAGEFGRVTLCQNKLDGMKYAIKISHRTVESMGHCKQLLREVVAHAKLQAQRHIVRYYSAWHHDGYMFIQSEYCDGGSLSGVFARRLRSRRPFSQKTLCVILKHVAKGAKCMHDQRLVHLDIKPDNIFIKSEDGALSSSHASDDSQDGSEGADDDLQIAEEDRDIEASFQHAKLSDAAPNPSTGMHRGPAGHVASGGMNRSRLLRAEEIADASVPLVSRSAMGALGGIRSGLDQDVGMATDLDDSIDLGNTSDRGDVFESPKREILTSDSANSDVSNSSSSSSLSDTSNYAEPQHALAVPASSRGGKRLSTTREGDSHLPRRMLFETSTTSLFSDSPISPERCASLGLSHTDLASLSLSNRLDKDSSTTAPGCNVLCDIVVEEIACSTPMKKPKLQSRDAAAIVSQAGRVAHRPTMPAPPVAVAHDHGSLGHKRVATVFKLGDLGLATPLDEPHIEEGDCHYIPRELLKSDRSDIDLTKVDVFFIGMTLYELASLQPLPKNGEQWHLLRDDSPPSFPHEYGYSREFEALVASMIRNDPSERPTLSSVLASPLLSARKQRHHAAESLKSPMAGGTKKQEQQDAKLARAMSKIKTLEAQVNLLQKKASNRVGLNRKFSCSF